MTVRDYITICETICECLLSNITCFTYVPCLEECNDSGRLTEGVDSEVLDGDVEVIWVAVTDTDADMVDVGGNCNNPKNMYKKC